MKSKRKKKILAAILCMVMVLTNNFSILAEGTEVPNEIIQPETPEQINESETEVIPEESKEEMPESEVTPQKPETEEMPQEEATPEEPKVEEVPQEEATPEKPKTEEVPQTEETPKELKYEDEQVSVVVTAVEEGAIPTGATLKVLPITLENNETKAQYEDVEKRIQEKVAEEEKEVAGFLAYDIAFVDGEGNEIEPNSKVKVSMNYKNAALPEDVKENGGENAEVSVLHLEEDENGNVKDVVDMSEAETTKVDALTTTEGPMVQNVEMETESFSVFTLIWEYVLGEKDELQITVIDVEGEEIEAGQLPSIEIGKATDVKTIAANITITDYKFLKAGIGQNAGEALKESNEIEQLKSARFSGWQYKKPNSKSWSEIEGGNKVYFIFESTKLTDFANCYTENGDKISDEKIDLSTIKETDVLSTVALKIPNYEFSYVTVVKENENPEVKRLRMTENGLQYSLSDSGEVWENVGTDRIRFIYRNSGGKHPTIATENTEGLIDISLYDYENEDKFGNFVINKGSGYANYNKWVWYWNKSYDRHAVQGIMDNQLWTADGKRPVGKTENYQGFPKVIAGDDNHITKDLFGNPVASGLNHLFTKDEKGYYEYDSAENYAYYDQTGNEGKNFIVYAEPKSKGNDKNGEFMPFEDFDEAAKWHYGMTIGFNFVQPENGKVNGEDMIFEFSGDDDVWVFVDGKLVLDIGGIHGIVGGNINFSTGKVTVENVVDPRLSGVGHTNTLGKSTTLKKIFGLKGETFEDYTEHRVEFFYLERGAGDANCKLKFNMPPIPKDSLQVKKEITNTDKEKYANVEFSFEVWLETEKYSEGCERVDGTWYQKLPDDTQYKIYKDGQDTGKSGIIKDGIFKLKHGETALFEGIDRNLKYYAVETEVSSDEFDKVEIPNWDVSYEDENGVIRPGIDGEIKPGQKFIAKSKPKRVGGNSIIIFRNRCSSANKRELWITKKMADGQTVEDGDTFAFKVFLEGTDGRFVQYGAGNPYYVVEGNETTENTPVQKVPDDGIIRGIKPGQSIVLTEILSGTEFRVEEVELDTSKYYDPVKTVDKETCDVGTIKDENGNLISDGTIKLKVDAKVTVINKKRVNTFHVKKVDSTDSNIVLAGAKFKLEQQIGNEWKIIKEEIITDDKGMITVSGLSNGNYRLTETDAPEGYIILEPEQYEFSLPYQKTDNDNVLVEESSKLPDGSYGEITKIVENQKKNWEIYKRSSSDKNLFIGGAEFELKLDKTPEAGKEPTTYYGISSSEENQKGKIIWYSSKDYIEDNQINETQMQPGIYIFKETKAPNGYILSSEEWTVELGDNGALVNIEGNRVPGEETEDKTKISYYFENTPRYELPSSGGHGTFVYTIGGTLLLMAATLLLYKMKRGEVLKS